MSTKIKPFIHVKSKEANATLLMLIHGAKLLEILKKSTASNGVESL